MRYAKISALALLSTTVASHAEAANAATVPVSCQTVTDEQIASLFDGWNAALASGDPKTDAKRYAVDSILLPTVSNTPRLTPESKKNYFKDFPQNKPQGRIDSRTIQIGCNSAFDAGLYTFTFADGKKVNARYSYIYA